MSEKNLAKIVNIIETSANTNNDNSGGGDNEDEGAIMAAMAAELAAATTSAASGSLRRGARPTTVRISTGHLPSYRLHEADEILAHKPTFSERFIRYLMVLIYLCGLCSLGFVLSIYHIFFWDSRMPPVHKSMIMKKPPGYG
ncbi:PREDICTED: uncharacterized protein LOC108360837 [Rhagoletis zephyria]|uniref:uncharacterized protein LOC108360837 n=1 Tax=Rhagoletis zephyria TaxID=28612 RepID=UPI00081177E8|nr:PREDICTED: uncharacterized protein LOC108360837 [Rhagoletis zephyria]